MNYNLCLLDARGCGQSGGQFTTLGIKESSDVYDMIKELQRQFGCKRMILYGRSMGAASVIKFVSENRQGRTDVDETLPKVEGIVLDSPFYTIKRFFDNFVRKKYGEGSRG